MIRTLLLVNPPQSQLLEGFPGSLVPLASFVAVRAPEVTTRILDLGRAAPECVEALLREELRGLELPALVGITTTTASYQRALHVARVAKRLGGDILVALGGHHASPQADVVLRHHSTDVDFVVRGEGERALLDLVTRLPDVRAVRGVSYADRGVVVSNPQPPLLDAEELDALPVEYPGATIHTAPGKFHTATYISARGCPLTCHFCSVADQGLRAKCIPRVVEDIRHLVVANGFRRIALEDNFFAASKRRTVALCNAVAELQRDAASRFVWDCQTRVESMQDPEVLAAMERAGCEAVYLGVESLMPDHLRYLGKTFDPDRYLRVLRERVIPALLRSRVDCYMNLQLGLPGETAAHREATLATLCDFGAAAKARGKTITVFPQLHVMYPGTRHFLDALTSQQFGPDTAEVFEAFTAWEELQQPILHWLGEHFAHGTGGIPLGILEREPIRRSEFEMDPLAVHRVTEYLDAMASIPGIEVFQYGRFLARSATAGGSTKNAPGHSGSRQQVSA